MATFYVLNPSREKIGLLQNYNSVQWREDYNGPGFLEVHASNTDVNKALLQIGNTLRYGASVADIRAVQYRDREIIAYGKSVGGRLGQRVILRTAVIKNVETDLRAAYNANERGLNIALGASAGLSEAVDTERTGGSLLDAFMEVLAAVGLGWRVDSDFTLRLYKGVDRRIGQPGVVGVLSDSADTINNIVLTGDVDRFFNVAVVAGEGEGLARIWTTAWLAAEEPLREARREVFVDARDLASTYSIEGDPAEYTYTPEEYEEVLKQRGREKLAETLFDSRFTADVINGNMTYGVDYGLGDIMPVKLVKYGVSFSARVVSATRIFEQRERVLVKVEKIS
jgi:hypothetical protein